MDYPEQTILPFHFIYSQFNGFSRKCLLLSVSMNVWVKLLNLKTLVWNSKLDKGFGTKNLNLAVVRKPKSECELNPSWDYLLIYDHKSTNLQSMSSSSVVKWHTSFNGNSSNCKGGFRPGVFG